MKTTKQLLLLLPMMTVAMCAMAQLRIVAPSGQDYTIDNITAASGQNITYKWFRDGVEIANATSATYTVPANLAKHENGLSSNNTFGARFQRAAHGIDCPGGMAMSNTITIYFCDLMVGGVCWARANVDGGGRINPNPWDLGSFYQWNKPTVAYSTTNPANGAAVSGWPTGDYAVEWANGFPCPVGWRLPTMQDFQNLHATSQPTGGIWVSGGVRDIPMGTNGKLYGYNTGVCTMTNMSGCIFLPAAGIRNNANGALTVQGTNGYYWSSTQASNAIAHVLSFTSSTSGLSAPSKAYGMTVRCVQDLPQGAVVAN